jgi:hypothetical protein
MKFSSFSLNAWLLAAAQSFVLSKPTQNCSTFAQNIQRSFASKKVTISSSTLIASNATSTNEFDYCEVVGKVAYTDNDTLNFLVYLPDVEAYTGRFMAVGMFTPYPYGIYGPSLCFHSGGGGMAGVVDTSNMMLQLNKGFAVAG